MPLVCRGTSIACSKPALPVMFQVVMPAAKMHCTRPSLNCSTPRPSWMAFAAWLLRLQWHQSQYPEGEDQLLRFQVEGAVLQTAAYQAIAWAFSVHAPAVVVRLGTALRVLSKLATPIRILLLLEASCCSADHGPMFS